MKKIKFFIIVTILLWAGGALWAAAWIDKLTVLSVPAKSQLTVARIFWIFTPAITRTKDTERALKFSWLNISALLFKKKSNELDQIFDTLISEFELLEKYLLKNYKNMSLDSRAKVATQLVTYLNRVELYAPHPNEALDLMLVNLTHQVRQTSPENQENWYRELMIRNYLKGNIKLFEENRIKLIDILKEHSSISDQNFNEGILSFYDGVLLCLKKQSDAATGPLSTAATKLAGQPKRTSMLLQLDLNVLLLGRGMESSASCNRLLKNVILAGA